MIKKRYRESELKDYHWGIEEYQCHYYDADLFDNAEDGDIDLAYDYVNENSEYIMEYFESNDGDYFSPKNLKKLLEIFYDEIIYGEPDNKEEFCNPKNWSINDETYEEGGITGMFKSSAKGDFQILYDLKIVKIPDEPLLYATNQELKDNGVSDISD